MFTLLLVIGLISVATGWPVLGWSAIAAAVLGWVTDQRVQWCELHGKLYDDWSTLGIVGIVCAVALGASAVLSGGG